MTPAHYTELMQKLGELRTLQRLRDRYKWDSLSPGERAKKIRLEKWVDDFLKEHQQSIGKQVNIL